MQGSLRASAIGWSLAGVPRGGGKDDDGIRGWFGRLSRHHGPAGQDLGVTPDLAWGLGFRGVWVGIGALLWVTGFLLFAVIVPIPGWLLSMVAIHR